MTKLTKLIVLPLTEEEALTLLDTINFYKLHQKVLLDRLDEKINTAVDYSNSKE